MMVDLYDRLDAAKHAFVDGWVQSMWVGVALAAVAFVYLLVRGPRPATVTSDPELGSFELAVVTAGD